MMMANMFIAFWVFSLAFLPTEEQYLNFRMGDKKVEIRGNADVPGRFYTTHWPDYHTPEKRREYRVENKDVATGRMTSSGAEEMVELFVQLPEDEILTLEMLNGMEGKRIWTLDPQKGNIDPESHEITGPHTRLFFYSHGNEYTTTGTESLGYLFLDKVGPASDSTVMVTGNFSLPLREWGGEEEIFAKGDFRMEFYIGL